MRRYLIIFSILICLVFGVLIFRQIILGGPVVSLSSDSLSTPLSQALQGTPGNYIPVEGKDYAIKETRYFYGKEWVVITVMPLGSASDSGSVVFRKMDGAYRQVYGPSNDFQGPEFDSLPQDVATYLKGGVS